LIRVEEHCRDHKGVLAMTQPIKPARRKLLRSPYAKLFGSPEINPTPKCAILVAHPSDEIAGAGGLLSKLNDVTVLHVTTGAPDLSDASEHGYQSISEYAKAREQESLDALSLAEVPGDRVVNLNIPDQAASLHLSILAKKIAAFLRESGSDIVITHPYEGGHPDHDATAFATHAAVRLMKEAGLRPPAVFEMALHPSPDFRSKVPEFLTGLEGETTTLLLDDRAAELKRRMFGRLATLRECLDSSPIGPERFRQASDYDFTALPNDRGLYYEDFDWALSGTEWRTLAQNALTDLFPQTARKLQAAN